MYKYRRSQWMANNQNANSIFDSIIHILRDIPVMVLYILTSTYNYLKSFLIQEWFSSSTNITDE